VKTDQRIVLVDAELGHEVGYIENDEMISRYGKRYRIDGYAVVDEESDEVVGSYGNGEFYNRNKKLMAIARIDS